MRKKHKARIIAERVMNICYGIGGLTLLMAASGFENATANNYIAMAISVVFLGFAVFIDRF